MAAKYEINALLKGLAASYPDWKPKDPGATMEQYEDSLQQFPLTLLEKAIRRCRDTCLFFPKIAEIRKACSEVNIQYTYRDENDPAYKQFMAEYKAQARINMDRHIARMRAEGKWTAETDARVEERIYMLRTGEVLPNHLIRKSFGGRK